MPVLDPSGFQMAVVVKRDDVRFPLWIGGARRDDVSIFLDPEDDFPDIPIVESVSVQIGRGLVGNVSVEISAPYDLGLALLESRLFTIGSVIEMQIGYPKLSRFIPWFSAMQTKPTVNLSQEEGLSATMNGEAGAFASMRNSSSATYNASYADIIEEIANDDDNQWTVSLPGRIRGGEDPLFADREGVSQGNMPDWYFIMHICRLANCDAYIANDPEEAGRNRVVVLRRSESMAGVPRYTFVSRGRADFVNTFPLLEFESSAERVWLPASAGEIRAAYIDPDTGEILEATASAEESETPRTAEAGVGRGSDRIDGTTVALESSGRDDRGTGERLSASPRASATPQEVVSSRSDEGQQAGGLNANISSIGIPEILPGEIIAVAGAGIFNGNYGIDSVQHEANAEEWTMNLKLLSNALFGEENLGSALLRRYRDFGQRVNDQPAEEEPEAASGATETVTAGGT